MSVQSSKILRGTIDTIIMSLLSDGREMYGYEMARIVEQRTDGVIRISEASLYPALHRLEAKGILETESRAHGQRLRKYYRLTDLGKKTSQEASTDLESYIGALRLIMNPKWSV